LNNLHNPTRIEKASSTTTAIGVDLDSPATVPTTADTAAADDVACPQSQSAAVTSDKITNALNPTKLQQWNAFYQDFIQSHKNY